MLSKTAARATAVALVLLTVSCSRVLPWRDEPTGNEVNLAFVLERNLIQLLTVQIDGRPGRFILGSAAPRTIIDPSFATTAERVQLSKDEGAPISPASMSLGNVADAIIGVEPWRNHALSIDYRVGLVTYQKQGIVRDYMTVYRYQAEPTILVNVDGVEVQAVVDTTSPDTLTLPASSSRRGSARVQVAGTDFGAIDVGYADVATARVGNRVLSKFLITIDYGKRVVGLWRDPRIAM
jgi:hypothetical protein